MHKDQIRKLASLDKSDSLLIAQLSGILFARLVFSGLFALFANFVFSFAVDWPVTWTNWLVTWGIMAVIRVVVRGLK